MQWYVTTDGSEGEPAGSEDEVMGAVLSVRDGGSEFFVVEPERGSEDAFIQGSVWTGGVILRPSYVAEVREPAGGGFVHWRLRTKDFGLVEDAVRSYIGGGGPVWRGWEDVTDEFLGQDD